MLKKRLIPVLLLKDGRMVKTIQFDKMRDVGNPVSSAKIYDAQNADELIFLDIDATMQKRATLYDIIDEVSEVCFMPLGVGGGVKTVEDFQNLLNAGADKVIINTQAVEKPEFITEVSQKFGKANVVVAIDYRIIDGKPIVHTHSGSKNQKMDIFTWSKKAEELGAGEIFLNSIDREGTMKGYDIENTKKITSNLSVPLILCGGAGSLQDFSDGIKKAGASAVAAGSIFHFTDQSPIKARTFLKESGINVRHV